MRPRQATFSLPARTPAPPATPSVSPEWPPLLIRWLVLFCWPQTPNNNHLRRHPLHLLRGLFLVVAGRPYPPLLVSGTSRHIPRTTTTVKYDPWAIFLCNGNRPCR